MPAIPKFIFPSLSYNNMLLPLVISVYMQFIHNSHSSGEVKIANYGGMSLAGKNIVWTLGDKSGKIGIPDGEGLIKAGDIDNIERNHKLGLVFEFAVGKGKLLVVMSDLGKASRYPEGTSVFCQCPRLHELR